MKYGKLSDLPTQPTSHDPSLLKKLLLDKQEIPHVTNVSVATFEPGQVAPLHQHQDMYEFFFVIEGSGTAKVDGQELQLTPQTYFLIQPKEEHEIANTGNTSLILFYFGLVE